MDMVLCTLVYTEILLVVFMNGHGPMYSGIHSGTLFFSL